ncbi:MAG: hypothetical protein QNJ20_03375 [Paracoccaceae bacterium]|nr:hypothetical protein [Paracoccaceae bacterium]
MIVRATLILLLCLASPLQAAPVKVSATEQPNLTRLLFEFDTTPQWEVTRTGRGFALIFRGEMSEGFDLSRVFLSVSRARLSDIRATGPKSVEIDLSCDCQISISRSGDVGLFLDIVAHAPVTSAETLPQFKQSQLEGELPGLAPSKRPMTSRTQSQSLPMPEVDQMFSAVNGFVQTDMALVIDELATPVPSDSRSLAVELMGRAFSRAASQGLVTADDNIGARAATDISTTPDRLSDRSNLSVTTGFDQVVRPAIDSLPPTETGAICLPDESVDVAAWRAADDKYMHGKLRSRMVAEDGSVDPEGAMELARYYLSLGFGAEAIATASYLDSDLEREVIEAIANIMDDGRTTSAILEGQVYCEGIVALWGALSAPIDPVDTPETPNFILSAFSALPPHLRSHLGPLLSERLRAAGMDSAARTALSAVTRGGKKTDESTLATARLDLTSTRAEDARDTLEDLSNGTDLNAAEALIELMLDAEARGMAPNPDWVDDAPTLVGALEGTEVAEKLNIAGLRGLVALGRFDDFRVAIVDDLPGLTFDTRRDLSAHALQTAVETADDAQFLKAEIGLSRLAPPDAITPAKRLRLADRLVGMGLPNRAAKYVSKEPASLEALTVAVNVLIGLDQAERAVALIKDSTVAGRGQLLGLALDAAGLEQDATRAFAAAGDDTRAVGSALQIADWDWIEENGDAPIAEAAETLRAPLAPDVTSSETPNGILIEASRTRRSQIEVLLNATSVSPAFTN